MKRCYRFVFSIIIVLVCIHSPSVIGTTHRVVTTGADWGPDSAKQLETSLNEGTDFEAESPDTQPYNHPRAGPMTTQGKVKASNGKLTGDKLTQKGRTFTDVTDLEHENPDTFTAAQIGRYEQPAEGQQKPTTLVAAVNIKKEGNKITADSADRVIHGGITVDQATDITILDHNIIRIQQAQRIEIPEGILTEVNQFDGGEIQFHIGSARDVVLGCITMRQVKDTDFLINQKNIEMEPAKDVSFHIADCGFSQNNFKAYSDNSKITISKSRRANYEITEGELKCHSLQSTETIEANTSANIQYGDSCFSCITMNIANTYWYNDRQIVRDFGLHVPEDGDQFKLCLKKDVLDYFAFFDGLIDFVDNQITLSKIITHLKYPFQNHQIAAFLMNNLLEDVADYSVKIGLDGNFTFIEQLRISPNTEAKTKPLKTITKPSNYYEIREQRIDDAVHRLMKINFRLNNRQLTQERISEYKTSYFAPLLNLEKNKATQVHNLSSITILPPDHKEISSLLQ